MKEITRVGIDLGKHVYQVCAMDAAGAVVFQRQVKAPRLMELMARIEPCRVGMEASGGAHRWVEKLIELGHDVRMMSPQFVRPYVKSNKSDYHDAEAICEAVSRPTMRFVALLDQGAPSIAAGASQPRAGSASLAQAGGPYMRGPSGPLPPKAARDTRPKSGDRSLAWNYCSLRDSAA